MSLTINYENYSTQTLPGCGRVANFMNPFIKKLALYARRAGKTKVDPSEIEEYMMEGSPEFTAEAEDVLDFDADLFPEDQDMFIYFPTPRLEGFEILYLMERDGNEIHCMIQAEVGGQSFYNYPFNLSRIQFEMNNYCKDYHFNPEVWEADSEKFNLVLSFISPAKGNMLQTFNEAWAKFETLYYQARNKIIKEVKEME